MKTFEIWKMIDECEDFEEMRKKEFKLILKITKTDRLKKGDIAKIGESIGGVRGLFLRGERLDNLTGFEEWEEQEEVRQAVDFMTAVKSGKKLIVEHDRLNREDMDFLQETYHFLGTILQCFSDFFNSQNIREVILNGKWYIE